jgi:hypothetical protein
MNMNVIKGLAFAAGLLGVTLVAGCGGGSGASGTVNTGNTGTPAPHVFVQIDRLSRPAINEVFATVANNRHAVNHTLNSPTDDASPTGLTSDIQSFMTGTAGRSAAITAVVQKVLIPDVMRVDLSQNTTKAAYLGVETAGATGSAFGGRALTDDVIDIDLGVIFGNTIPALGLAPDDGKEIPTLTTDNVGYDKHCTLTAFPYVGAPQ